MKRGVVVEVDLRRIGELSDDTMRKIEQSVKSVLEIS